MKEFQMDFAWDENNNLVHIRHSLSSHEYHCIHCGNVLSRNTFKPHNPYFSHSDGVECDLDSYLLKLAGDLVKYKFEHTELPFDLQFYGNFPCCMAHKCEYYINDLCKSDTCSPKLNIRDLSKYYNKIAVGRPLYYLKIEDEVFLHFADFAGSTQINPGAVLYSDIDDLSNAILIEFCHNKPGKFHLLNLGLRIIEVHFTDQVDLFFKIFGNWIEEQFGFKYRNFDKTKTLSESPNHRNLPYRFVLYKGGKANVLKLSCKEQNLSVKSNSISELDIYCDDDSLHSKFIFIGLAYLAKNRNDIKNCMLCQHYQRSKSGKGCYCKQLRKDNVEQNTAISCEHYLINSKLIDELSNIDSKIKIVVLKK